MKYWIVVHHHRYGYDVQGVFPFVPDLDVIAAENPDFEADRDDEYLEAYMWSGEVTTEERYDAARRSEIGTQNIS